MLTEPMRRPIKAAAMLSLATLVWGASFLAMKALGLKQQELVPAAGTWFITSFSVLARFGISAVLLGLCSGRKICETTQLELWQGAGLGIFCGAGILLQMDGVQYTSASTAAFLTQCNCILIPIILACHRRKMPGPRLILCCVMVMAGVAVLSNIDFRKIQLGRGEAESIFASVVFTGQILWLERPVFHANRNAAATFAMFATVTLLVVPVVLLTGTGPRQWAAAYASWPAVMLIVFLAVGCTLAAYLIMNYWQPHVSATQAGLIYCCEPMFASVFALFLPGYLSAAFAIHYANEVLTVRLLAGGGLITAANLLAMWPIPRPSPVDPATDRGG